MSNDTAVIDRIIGARAALLTMAPFFGVLASRLQPVIDTKCKTLWTDSKTLGVNPKYVEKLSKLELQAVLTKLVLQLSSGHAWRMGARSAGLWNKASTFAVMPALAEMQLVYPGKIEVRSEFDGLSAEGIYLALLQEEEDKKPETPPPAPSPSAPSKPEPPKGGEGNASGSDDDSSEKSEGTGPSPDGAGSGEAGEGESDGKAPGAEDDSGFDEPGEIRQAPAGENCEAEWGAAVKTAASLLGKLSASALLSIKDELVKPLPWKQMLNHFARQLKGRTHYSFSKPNRNYLHRGLILPGKKQKPRLRKVVVVRDTSGSTVNSPYMGMFNAAVQEFLDEMNPEKVYILDCDARVTNVQTVMPDRNERLEKAAKGGGGTKFGPAFEWVKEQGFTDVDCLIYLTDMEGSFPEKAPLYPVLWVKTDLTYSRTKRAPFGQEITLTAY